MIIIIIVIVIVITNCNCHSVAVVLTLIKTKKLRINIHQRNNTKHSKYKYTYYQNPHTLQNPHTHTHTHTHTLQNNLKQPQGKLKQTHYKIKNQQNAHFLHQSFNLILVPSTCSEPPSVHPQQDCMHKSSCGWTLGYSKHVEGTRIKLKLWCKIYAFCWFLVRSYCNSIGNLVFVTEVSYSAKSSVSLGFRIWDAKWITRQIKLGVGLTRLLAPLFLSVISLLDEFQDQLAVCMNNLRHTTSKSVSLRRASM
jgi:hypothetical protein